MINETSVQDFRAEVLRYYQDFGRHDLPWRAGPFNPYAIMVSEIMLQQTQVSRVIPKYREFLERFPDVQSLAAAPLGDVLRAWSGLGYNRRAKYLHQAAQQIANDYSGEFPRTVPELVKLSGIGMNTAGAIMAYAFNQPVSFIETNIRTVFIHHFFHDETGIPDKEILGLVKQTFDSKNPREWYWALMDYGSSLKQNIGNLNRQSRTYAKQSKFAGSRRQIRGQVLKLLGEQPQTQIKLGKQIQDERLDSVITELLKENLINRRGRTLSL